MTPSDTLASKHLPYALARRVGFGLGPQDEVPADPLAWAKAQLHQWPSTDVLATLPVVQTQGGSQTPPWWQALAGSTAEAVERWSHLKAMEIQVNRQSARLSSAQFQALLEAEVRGPLIRMEHWRELVWRGAMAVHGPAPVFERFWHFWANHFMVAPGTQNNDPLVGHYQRALREHMTGRFEDLLLAAVTHPGMLTYLDNHLSTGPRARARREGWTSQAINENLGRELLELFTVSPAAGYTQADVLQTTYILTGWRVMEPRRNNPQRLPLGTYFDWNYHEPGSQQVMGQTFSAAIRQDSKLPELVRFLARHPATARHLALKLCRNFLGDDPPAEAVERVRRVFQETGGQLIAVHEAVVDVAAQSIGQSRKFLPPDVWLWQAHRSLGQALPMAPPWPNGPGIKLNNVLEELGQALPRCPQPDGWPILSTGWLSREMLDRRIRYALQLARSLSAARLQALARQGAWSVSGQGRTELVEDLALWLVSPDRLWS